MSRPQVTPNGPAIEAVCVAESNGGDDLLPGYDDNPTRAVMSEAWRNFCNPGTSFYGEQAQGLKKLTWNHELYPGR